MPASTTGDKTVSIAFPHPFSKIPTIMCVSNEVHWNKYFDGAIDPREITVNGFKAYASCISSNAYSWNFTWIAFEI